MSSRICGSRTGLDGFYSKLRLTPCPHCSGVGNLIRHGFLRGYNEEQQPKKTIRAARVFCSNRNRAKGCGRTFSVWMASRIRRLVLSAESLWAFLSDAVSTGNKWQAFARLNCSLSDSAPYRIWRRFQKAQSAIRTALCGLCAPPKLAANSPAELTLAHLQKALQGHTLCPVAAFAATLQTFFV